jgi:hypothetical protein
LILAAGIIVVGKGRLRRSLILAAGIIVVGKGRLRRSLIPAAPASSSSARVDCAAP